MSNSFTYCGCVRKVVELCQKQAHTGYWSCATDLVLLAEMLKVHVIVSSAACSDTESYAGSSGNIWHSEWLVQNNISDQVIYLHETNKNIQCKNISHSTFICPMCCLRIINIRLLLGLVQLRNVLTNETTEYRITILSQNYNSYCKNN